MPWDKVHRIWADLDDLAAPYRDANARKRYIGKLRSCEGLRHRRALVASFDGYHAFQVSFGVDLERAAGRDRFMRAHGAAYDDEQSHVDLLLASLGSDIH